VRATVCDGPEELGDVGARLIAGIPDLRSLGVATGDSPLPVYERLALTPLGGRDLTVFALDEYVGLEPTHPASYHAVVAETITRPLGLSPVRVHVPEGASDDPDAAADDFERRICEFGGLDLQILGLGSNGHIAFNEPGSPFSSRTRVVRIAEQTRRDNARFFGSAHDVPTHAITQGIATILSARRILVVARGPAKAAVVSRLLAGDLDPAFPASALHRHEDVTVLLDREAASLLDRRSA
jgi:glucosamine-6-phosphate deaminase